MLDVSKINRRTFLGGAAAAATSLLFSDFVLADNASPDRREDPQFLQHQIKEISDADLFASIDLSRPALNAVHDAVASQDYATAYRAWGEYWHTIAPSRGRFLGDGDLLMTREQAIQSFEPQQAQILAAAERVLSHKINGWGDVTIQHGPVVNFDADYGKNGKYGFNYWGWSRSLIRAYLLTADAKYLDGFETLFNQWYEQRNNIHGGIPELDVVYYELGLGNRCRPFLEFYCLAKPQPATHEHMLKAMLGAARWLYEEENRKYRGGNWQIMGSFGLAWIGAMLPEFSDSDKWVRLGADRLAKHMEADFFPDGCHSERVPSSYMLVAYRDPRNLAMLLSDRPEYADVSKRIQPGSRRVLEWYFAMLPPDRFIPGINDGSRVKFPEALVRDARDLFRLENMPAEAGTPIRNESVCLPASGFTAMRTDDSESALYMLINHGPSGGGHSHADSLDFELHAYGQAMALDSGIGYTYDDPHHHPWYVRTRAHNGITIDGDDLDRKQAEGRDVVWSTLKSLDYFAATQNGYLESKGVTHRRHIVFVKPLYWFVYDVIESKNGSHVVATNLHCTVPMEQRENGFCSNSKPGLLVLQSNNWKPDQSTGPASVRGIRGFGGKDYADIDWIWFEGSVDTSKPATIGCLLFPSTGTSPQVRLSALKQEQSAGHFMMQRGEEMDYILIGPGESGDIQFDGAAAVVRYRGDKPVQFAAVKSLTLKVAGKSLLESQTPRDAEVNF
jgi:hypothetical protein